MMVDGDKPAISSAARIGDNDRELEGAVTTTTISSYRNGTLRQPQPTTQIDGPVHQDLSQWMAEMSGNMDVVDNVDRFFTGLLGEWWQGQGIGIGDGDDDNRNGSGGGI